jgi:hypothetical protein
MHAWKVALHFLYDTCLYYYDSCPVVFIGIDLPLS